MRRRAEVLALSTLLVVFACTSNETIGVARARLAEGCSLNSDCSDDLVCAYGKCHLECLTSRDCKGTRCVTGPSGKGICQLEDLRQCARHSDCTRGQLCGPDDQCRDECAADRDCRMEQVCTGGLCAEPAELVNGRLSSATETCRYASDCPAELVCLRGRCDVECVTDKDCFVSWSCKDTRCRPATSTPLVACIPGSSVDGGLPTPVGSVTSILFGGGVSQIFSNHEAIESYQCATRSDGRTLCRGSNGFGQLGSGTMPAFVDTWTPLVTGSDAVELALGAHHACGILRSGNVECWGENHLGATGDGPSTGVFLPRRVLTAPGVPLETPARLRAGWGLSCAIFANGKVSCWGKNDYAQLGRGTQDATAEGQPYAAASKGLDTIDVVDLRFSFSSACALTRNGEVDCWGLRSFGLVADGTPNGPAQLTAAKIVDLDAPVGPIRQVVMGFTHACVLGAQGDVLCWGLNNNFQVGQTDTSKVFDRPQKVAGLPRIRALASSDRSNYTCAIGEEGDVRCWGANANFAFGQAGPSTPVPVRVPGVDGAVDLSVAVDGVCARRADGSTICWGSGTLPHVEPIPCP